MQQKHCIIPVTGLPDTLAWAPLVMLTRNYWQRCEQFCQSSRARHAAFHRQRLAQGVPAGTLTQTGKRQQRQSLRLQQEQGSRRARKGPAAATRPVSLAPLPT